MAKLKNPFTSLSAVGKIANAFTIRRHKGEHVAEAIPSPTDIKSPAQLAWRHMYQKAIALWHALSITEQQEWESLARPKHMTGYNYFISLALKPNPGLYLPLQGGTMQGAIDMAKYRLLKLPTPSDAQEADNLGSRNTAIATHAGLPTVHQNAPALIAVHAALPNVHHTPPAGTFIGLTDTPASYAGEALKVARVNAAQNAIEFATIAGGYTEGARVWHTAHQNLPNNVLTTIAWDSEEYDTNIIHDNAVNNSRLTCKTAGKYLIIALMNIEIHATGNRYGEIHKNGALATKSAILGTNLDNVWFITSTILDMAVNDYVQLLVRQTAGVARLLHCQVGGDRSRFMLQRIG